MPDKVQDANGLEINEVGNLLVLLQVGSWVGGAEGAVIEANTDQEGAQVLSAACPQHLVASILHQRKLPCIVHHAHRRIVHQKPLISTPSPCHLQAAAAPPTMNSFISHKHPNPSKFRKSS